MTESDLHFLPATPDDVETLAIHIRETSEGIVDHLLHDLIPGFSPEEFLAMALRESDTHFHPDNMAVLKHRSDIVGLLFAYPADQQGIPKIMDRFLPRTRIDPVRAILTTSVPDTLYMNTIWTHPDWRGAGLGDLLMEHALLLAKELCLQGVSLHVWRDNARALAFYSRHGFREYQALPALPPLSECHPLGSFILVREEQ